MKEEETAGSPGFGASKCGSLDSFVSRLERLWTGGQLMKYAGIPSRSVLLRVLTGVLVGSLTAVGSRDSLQHAALKGVVGPSTAFAANNCQYFVGNQFTGIYDSHGYGGITPATSIIAQLSTTKPGFICNNGLANWDMVNETATQCTQSGKGVYAQAGWLIDGYGNPQHFYEHALLKDAPSCDLYGPFIYAASAWGTSHNYRVDVYGAPQGILADYFTDGVLMNTLQQDWQEADNYQLAAEIAYSEEYLGGQTFRSIYHCESGGGYGCSPSTSMNVGSDCANGNTQGCLSPKNANGCYYFNSSGTTYNGFNVYEKRSKNPPSC
jgi:hypothetical protein